MAAQTSVATGVGTTFSTVATAPGTFDGTGYAALTWVPVGEVADIPSFGKQRSSVSFTSLNGQVQKFGSVTDNGKLTLSFGLNTDDAGQMLLKAAVSSAAAYSFKVAHINGDVYYFRAIVLSFVINIGNGQDVTTATAELDITATSAGVGIVEVLGA